MSEKGIINNALHRPLTGGNSFNKYIPSSTCEKSYLGEGDTFFSMDGIKANILKNYTQTAKLAPQLQKNSLSETVTSIYDFLYNHIQYKADGADQNLRSPACSWHVRKEGIDCKSYSIFAGCLLASLGIKFYIRKIKQPGMLPSEFTHVYIIVPKDQKTGSLNSGYFVIDATKHQNTEADFIEKNDVFMGDLKHFGLQAPATCATSAGTIKGNFAPVSETAKQGFRDFLSYLQEIGIDQRVICKIRNTVKQYLDRGINPEFAPAPNGVVIEGELIKYAYPEKHGRKTYRSPLAIAYAASKEKVGLSGSGGGSGSGSGTTTNEGDLGEELGTVITGMIDDSSWWDNTFGAIFGNGFMLSCWGSSNSPKKSANEVKLDASEYFKMSGLGDASKGGLNTANFQKFVDMASAYMAHREFGSTNGQLAECTKKGNKVGYEGMAEVLYQVISTTKKLLQDNGGTFTIGSDKTLTNYHFYPVPSGYLNSTGGLHDDSRFATKSKNYTIYAPNPIVLPPPPPPTTGNGGGGITIPPIFGGGGNTGGGTTTPPTGGTGGGTTTPPPTGGTGGGTTTPVKPPNPNNPWNQVNTTPKTQEMGMNNLLVLGLVGGAIYMAYKKRQKK